MLSNNINTSPKNTRCLVTCIYDGYNGTKFGGRGSRIKRYLTSFASIIRSNPNTHIVCYSEGESLKTVEAYLRTEGLYEHVDLQEFSLEKYKHHEAIQHIKEKMNTSFALGQRCIEMIWGKFEMCELAAERYPSCDKIYWIDAGILHVDIIPHKYSESSTRLYDYVDCDAIDHNFFNRAEAAMGSKILAFTHTAPNNRGLPEKYREGGARNNHGIIGGIFGGNVDTFKKLINRFNKKIEDILHNEEIYFEENVLTTLFHETPDIFWTKLFDQWPHPDFRFKDYYRHNRKAFSEALDEVKGTESLMFCNLSYGVKHNNQCLKLIDTFLLNVVDDSKLLIMTDDPSHYSSIKDDRIIVEAIELPEKAASPGFPFSAKLFPIKRCWEEYTPDCIVFLDCDITFTGEIDSRLFLSLPTGLSVAPNYIDVDYINNGRVRARVDLVTTPEDQLCLYKEQCMPFKVGHKGEFRKFLQEWESIYNQAVDANAVQNWVCVDIGIAAHRAGFAINNIKELPKFNEMRSMIKTDILGTIADAIV